MVDIYRIVLFKSGWYYRQYVKNCRNFTEFHLLLTAIKASSLTPYLKLVNATACGVILVKAETLSEGKAVECIWAHFFPEL